MNTKLLLPVALLSVAALSIEAGSPTYASKNAAGTSSAEVIFPADPTLQIRVVNAIGSSDKAGSLFSFRGGDTAIVVSLSNTNVASTTLVVPSYAGISTNDLVIVSTPTTNRTMTVSGMDNSTNVTVSAAIGFAQVANQTELYHLAAATTIGCGATTNKQYSGEAIYVAPRGRPLRVLLDGTSFVSLDSVVVRYE